jgi:hypothetical protein
LAYQRVKAHTEAKPLPPIHVEGIHEPIEVYELLRLK